MKSKAKWKVASVIFLLAILSVTIVAYAIDSINQTAAPPLLPAAALGDPVVQAALTGPIEQITVANIADTYSGGTITVNGQTVIIPRNLVFFLPANFLTLQQLFADAPADCVAAGETGLAASDTCASAAPSTITLLASRLPGGNLVAGEGFIDKGIPAPASLSGQVTYIDYDDGYFRVNGAPGDPLTGTMVRLNDPDGRHTVQPDTASGCLAGSSNCSADPRFTNDPDNYTFVFTTGYPACIPSSVARSFTDVLDLDQDLDTAELLTAQFAPPSGTSAGTDDLLCPSTNRTINGGNPVDDSRRFAPLQVGDWVDAEGNMETIGGVPFLSAHTIVVGAALTTKDEPGQPDYMIFDEVEWDVPGFQNERARVLLIGFTTLPSPDVDVFSLRVDPATNGNNEYIFASTAGCEAVGGAAAGGVGLCTGQGIPPNNFGIFRIRYDVDFFEATINPPGEPVKPKLSPCQHLNNANLAAIGHTSPCSASPTIGEEFSVVSPVSRELIGRTRHKSLGDPALLITLDITGQQVPNGQYLNPVGIGHPEFGEIDLAALQTPFIFAGQPWLLDRRLGPDGCASGVCEPAPQPLCPFPYSGLDPRRQADNVDPVTGATIGVPADAEDRIFAFHPFGPTDLLSWPPPPNASLLDGYVVDPSTMDWSLLCPGGVAPNSPPTAVDDTAVTDDATPVTIDVLNNDTDVDGTIDPATVIIVTNPSSGTAAADSLTGAITYTPTLAATGLFTMTYTVDDNEGATSNAATVTVTVTAVGANIPPFASDDLAATDGVIPVTITVLANDTDDGAVDPATVAAGTPTNGTVTVNPDGTITYTPYPTTDISPVAEGPIHPDYGFPTWYQDSSGLMGTDVFTYTVSDDQGEVSNVATVTVTRNPLVLQICLDIGLTGPCLFDGDPALGELPLDPGSPPSVPDNFAPEAFWWMADAAMPTNGGQALLTLALEATFLPGDVIDGDQAWFARTRIRVDNLIAGETYTVTHPYGVQTFVAANSGQRGINFTTDLGVDPGTTIFDGFPGPLLVWDDAAPAPPAGYIGDPNIAHTVTGSPSGNNVFRIEGPSVGGPGVDMIETDLFTVIGKLGTPAVGPANTAPVVSLTSPTDGSSFLQGTPVGFAGSASDAEEGDLSANLTWTSDLDGVIGSGVAYSLATLSPGTHTITVSVADSGGLTDATAVTITITPANTAPTVSITSPADGSSFLVGTAVSFAGSASDAEEGDLSAGLSWTSSLDGAIGSGASFSSATLSVGMHTITASVTDGGGLTGSASITITVTTPANTAPIVSITSPADGASFAEGTAVSFTGSANDAEEGDLSAGLSWTSDLDGAIGSGASFSSATLSAGVHTITASVTDGGGLTGTATATITITPAPPADTITVTRVEFRANRNEWRIQGGGSVPGETITIYVGPTIGGAIIGTAQVDAAGVWKFRQRNSPVGPDATETISVESTGGGVFLAVPIRIR